jgi:orotate phosphoribosyltransferase
LGIARNVWLDLERLCLRVDPIKRFASEIAVRVSQHKADIVCAPLVEGAFVGMMVALELGLPFTYSERIEGASAAGLYPIRYRLPGVLRAEVRGKRVAIVNDVINAGSAVHGTYLDLVQCESMPVVIGCLAVLGEWASVFTKDKEIRLETLVSIPHEIWTPSDCPLCAQGIPVTR